MTDKQIIIDGKQTTKEDFTDNFSIELTNCNIEKRKQIGSRYFDIILHKEQECEKAKQNAQDTYDLWQALIESFNILQSEKIKLEQECEELKKYQYEQEFLQEQLDKVIKENKELKTCYKNNLTLLDKEEVNTTKLVNKVMKLEKILTEIKEIAKPFCEECKEFDDLHKEKDCMYCNYGKILQKINECEINNEC